MEALVVAQQGTTTQSKNPLPSSFIIIILVSLFIINCSWAGRGELKIGILLQLIIAIMVVTLLRPPFSSLL